ncbi:MAG: DUF3168 domain-containing protein [Planctomycetota bacterium]
MTPDVDTAVLTCIRLCPEVLAAVADRVRPVVLGQGDRRPAITYEPVEDDHFDGVDGSTSEYTLTTYDFDIYADTHTQARFISEALRKHLHSSEFVAAGIDCTWFCDGTRVVRDKPTDGAPAPVYHIRQTYRLLWAAVD